MSLPAQPWPYAFWPARLDLALTGLPPSCKDSAPPLDALRPRFVQAALLRYVLPIFRQSSATSRIFFGQAREPSL